MEPAVTALFDEATNTVSYIVADPATAKAAIVDCVLDFNPKSARTSTCSADRLIEAVREGRMGEVETGIASGKRFLLLVVLVERNCNRVIH